MENEISTENKNKFRVYWDDKPENYSRETKNKIRTYFSKKYNIPPARVNVVFRPVKTTAGGALIKIGDSGIDNILDVNYQRELFKEWIKRENVDIDFDRIIALDNKVISESEIPTEHNGDVRWGLKWLKINGFLSFGDNETINFEKLHGLNLVNSIPRNTGGKTTFSIDTLRFLFFGNTSKTEKNEQIFNSWLKDNNSLLVRGGIDLDGEDYVIERGLKRSLKRNKIDYSVSGYVKYTKLFPDGSEMDLDEEESKSTTKKIEQLIGSEADFELMILATHRNLTDLIDSTSTNKSRLLNKFVGLDPIEAKEKMVRKMYNAFTKTMQANHYDITTLTDEITEHKVEVVRINGVNLELTQKIEKLDEEITTHKGLRDTLLSSKHNIDDKVLSVNESELKTYIDDLIQSGVNKSKEVEAANIEIKEIGEVDYDEDLATTLQDDKMGTVVKQTNLTHDNQNLVTKCDQLKSAEICPTCSQPLKGVDNTSVIKDHKKTIDINKLELVRVSDELERINKELKLVEEQKVIATKKDKLELKRDRLEVEMDALRNKIKEKRNLLKEFQLNRDAIDKNKKIESDITWETSEIQKFETQKSSLTTEMTNNGVDIHDFEMSITKKLELIKIIEQEDEKERVFKVYIEMIGKRGISKLIMRSLLPIINSELQRLLNDTTNFDVELNVNSKNDIEFNMIEDGVIKPLKSGSGFESTAAAIALRSVLSRITTLPVPNFITFDEIFGTVAEENLPAMEGLFKRVSEMYDFVFIITHNELVKDWADNILTVTKENHVSKISVA